MLDLYILMKSKHLLFGSIISAISIVYAHADVIYATPVISGASSHVKTENRVFAGLVWTTQEKMSAIPDLTLGVRTLRIKSTDRMNGLEVGARFHLIQGVSLESTRLSFIAGERRVLGNIGVGYSVPHSSFLGNLAVQGDHARFGTDYLLNSKKFVPFAELLTVKKPNKVHGNPGLTTYVCPEGTELDGTHNGQPTCTYYESDGRLKDEIELVATMTNGLKIYSFKYKSREGKFVGVMAQDLLQNIHWSKALIKRHDGYYMVNYNMLGIQMTTFENWIQKGMESIAPNGLKAEF